MLKPGDIVMAVMDQRGDQNSVVKYLIPMIRVEYKFQDNSSA